MTATMTGMPYQIELYEEMCALSTDMVAAAQANDWDHLIALESEVTRLRLALMASDDGKPLSPQATERKRDLIQHILENDAEVRRHTEPWMEHVRQFLGSHNKARTMQKAYATGAGDTATGSLGA